VFTHKSESILVSLCRGFGDGLSHGIEPSKHCFDATRLIHPDSNVIGTLMRAINKRQAVSCEYNSFTSGNRREANRRNIGRN
jgi:hypothetical protein